MTVFSNPAFDDHEAVHAFHDRKSGLKGFIAIHSRALGPAFGGCRMWVYDSDAAALTDALRLSKGMSYKNAIADLPFGGGKAVIIANPKTDKSEALFEAFGRVVDGLGGAYLTAEDVGINVEDMKQVARATSYVSGIGGAGGSSGGDPSPKTAWGVFLGITEAVKAGLGKDSVKGLRVAVQGVGHVGMHVCRYLHEAGARLAVADIDADNIARAAKDFDADVVAPEEIVFQEADVLAPCALGGVLNAKTIPDLNVPVVAGAANNQLASVDDGTALHTRGIVYAPDYVINAGGIVAVSAEYLGNFSEQQVRRRIGRIGERLSDIFARSRDEDTATNLIADQMAREIIAGAV